MLQIFQELLKNNTPKVDFYTWRLQNEDTTRLACRSGVLEPIHKAQDLGAHVTLYDRGASGYGSTAALNPQGIKQACERALRWTQFGQQNSLVDYNTWKRSSIKGQYRSAANKLLKPEDQKILIGKIKELEYKLRSDSRVVDALVSLEIIEDHHLFFDSQNSEFENLQFRIIPRAEITLAHKGEVVTRSFKRGAAAKQGGLEVLEQSGFWDCSTQLLEEGLELLSAPNCPDQVMDLLLDPDQMILQIHESIGHPLELDRILGDERNFAGTSFVTLDMFGSYRYGSQLLNISFDPSEQNQIASYGADDEGLLAQKDYLIKDGILLKPLGGSLSYQRAGLAKPVACTRATSWNRPAIDRMANLNLEPGHSTLDQMISQIENGIWMQTNCSWSIDDSRNKFQFGCERGVLIKNGKLKHVVKNPCYRGISANFWRNLAAVGDQSTYEVLGTPHCGKGEPNQVIHVGHASPTCLFKDISVFGGV